jgi:hypothetical protein
MSFRSFLGSTFRSRAALTFCLVVALLWAPIWGQWHGIAHQVQQAVVVPSDDTAADQDEGHALGSALCQVLDHLGHASALASWPVVASLVQFPVALPVWQTGSDSALRPWWPTRARAPPFGLEPLTVV